MGRSSALLVLVVFSYSFHYSCGMNQNEEEIDELQLWRFIRLG